MLLSYATISQSNQHEKATPQPLFTIENNVSKSQVWVCLGSHTCPLKMIWFGLAVLCADIQDNVLSNVSVLVVRILLENNIHKCTFK